MSWDYHIAADAWPSIHVLDVALQEALLDELDFLCDMADERAFDGETLHQIYLVAAGEVRALTLVLLASRQRRLITLLDVDA